MADIFLSGSVDILFNTTGTLSRVHSLGGTIDIVFTVSGEPIYQELLIGTGFELRVYDQDHFGELLAVIPKFESLAFEDVISDTGSGKVKLATDLIDHTLLEKEHLWRIYWEGQERFAFLAENVEEDPTNDKEVSVVEISGRGTAQSLSWATIYPQQFGTVNEATVFWAGPDTRAAILIWLLGLAEQRGVLDFVEKDNWTAEKDSAGATWTDANEFEMVAGGDYLKLLREWAEGFFEWHMDSEFKLGLWKNGMGIDKSQSVILLPGNSAKLQKIIRDRRDMATVVMAEDSNTGVSEIEDIPAILEWRRREKYIVFEDAIDDTTREASGEALLSLLNTEIRERRVEITPDVTGRRPFVDFNLGDIVGVRYPNDETVHAFRVLGIALGVDEDNNLTCEVTLEFMVEAERRRRRALLENNSSAHSGSEPQLVFADNGAELVITPVAQAILQIGVEAFRPTYAKAGIMLRGIASTQTTITVEVRFGGNLAKTFDQVLFSGRNTFAVPWIFLGIAEGVAITYLSVVVSAGLFTILQSDAQYWLEAKFISGNLGVQPVIIIDEAVELPPHEVGETVIASVDPPPIGVLVEENVTDEPIIVTETLTEDLIVEILVAATGDDGFVNGAPSYNTGNTYTVVGDDGGISHDAWYRFILPVDLGGRTIHFAYLTAVGDQTVSGSLTKILADDAQAAAAPASKADFDGRVRTTASVDWDIAVTSGTTYRSPDITSIIQELVDNHGSLLTSVLILHEDDSSPTNSRMVFRAEDHASSPPLKLTIAYL